MLCKIFAVSEVSKSGKSLLVSHGHVQLNGIKGKANFKILMIRAGLKPDIVWLHAQVPRADFLVMHPFVHSLTWLYRGSLNY